jgi:glucose-6-phosphate 1-dehydrogenase
MPEAPAMAEYEPNSWGPAEADLFMSRDGRKWVISCGGN